MNVAWLLAGIAVGAALGFSFAVWLGCLGRGELDAFVEKGKT
jgi:hypothetical protein